MNRFGLALGVAAALAAPVSHAETRVIPFTTYQAEEQAIVRNLPCKWVSMGGKFAGGHYDFLCKGGTWATVSLFLDKSEGISDGVGSVKLQYVEWNPKVHPNAGEAFEAQKFLTHVVDRFVPGSAAASVLEAFWAERGRKWSGSGVNVAYTFDDQRDYDIHRLEITGQGRTLVGANGLVATETVGNAATEVTPSDAGLLRGARWSAPEPKPVGPVQWTESAVPVGPNVLPVPTDGSGQLRGAEIVVPAGLPAAEQDSSTMEKAKAALKGMLEKPTEELEKASPDELNTAPEPDSRAPETAPPAVSTTLVPDPEDIERGRPQAPSNYSAYNKAEELTRDIEKRARTNAMAPNKVKTSDEAQKTLTMPEAKPAESVKATPTPKVGTDKEPITDALVPGKSKPMRLSPEEMDSGGLGNYDPMNPGRSKEVRPLPQLKFIPRAEPLRSPDQVIQFEDEGSKL